MVKYAFDICRTCTINKDFSYTCEKDAAITGANAQEGANCGINFIPHRIDAKSAMICDETNFKVKKVTCADGLEVACISEVAAALGGSTYRVPVCIDTKEAECKADVFTCATDDSGAAFSLLSKGCANTDKGRHFVTKANALGFEEPFTTAMECGSKGCNQASGACNR